ncbi:MAG TPA: BON domain-containing protein [Thermoanaerobaculia bacterium]|jgi:osmotically-inducible protein OsmY|nr:BON domain-containing protein [Thermoanaerobaculia bacterium]
MSSPIPKVLLAAALLASLLSACASTVPTERSRAADEAVREQEVSDARLEHEIRLALLEKLGRDVLGVTVDVKGGRVRLFGAVDKRSTQDLAEEVVKAVPGVREVDDDLSNREEAAPGTPVARAVGHAERKVDDAVLEMRVGKNLLEEIGRYALDLEVEVSDGVVSLRGTLPDRERRSLALRAAEGTSGVRKVIDLLKVQGR